MSNAQAINASQAAQSAVHHKDARRHRRADVRMVQNVLLVWLDEKIDENSNDCQNTIRNLRATVNTINTFTDGQKCIQFLEDMADEKACMIISGALGQHIVPRVHNLSQVDSIFIFCGNKEYHEAWAKDWSKIKGVFTEIGPICRALKRTARQCEQNAISISIMGHDDNVEKSGNRLEPSFMYTQIMKEILLTIRFEEKHINEFIQHCREAFANNEEQLKDVNKLARKYRRHSPIWWYTYESFLYPMLNRALRVMDADLIIRLGFFIGDLHRHIEELHQKQFDGHGLNQQFTVYRGQGMDKDAFNKMIANKGGLLSFNNFLSTSKNRSTALKFAEDSLDNAQLVAMLFVMNIDPLRCSTPFASIVDFSYFEEQEDEVLFSMHTVFRIGEITPMEGHARLVQVQLNLVNDKDNDLCQLIDYMRKETFPEEEGWYRLGSVLRKMGEFAKAQLLYEILLEQEANESAKAPIYYCLGMMKKNLGEYAEGIEYYKKSIKIEEKQVPRSDRNLANSYIGIGSVYYYMNNYREALSSYEKALTIQQQSLPPTHLDLADSYIGIGLVHYSMGDCLKALSSYENALTIKQQKLPAAHPDLAVLYNNIGNVYYKMNQHVQALSSYENALAIRQQSLPLTHPYLAMSYNNLGLLHDKMGYYSKAHWYFEHAVQIAERSLPVNHPDLQDYRNRLADIKKEVIVTVVFEELKRMELKTSSRRNTHADRETLIFWRRQEDMMPVGEASNSCPQV